jgi:hypothetical protein
LAVSFAKFEQAEFGLPPARRAPVGLWLPLSGRCGPTKQRATQQHREDSIVTASVTTDETVEGYPAPARRRSCPQLCADPRPSELHAGSTGTGEAGMNTAVQVALGGGEFGRG